jgi:glycosyltransferase involved in cell wall biosynthesis
VLFRSYGLPVIGFSSGGMTEIVMHGETGLLVDEGDIDALADAMHSFVAAPSKITAMGIAGRERAQRLFDREKQIPLIAEFILRQQGE